MLEILDTHRQDKDLCLLAAKTVLKVVDNHQIVFEYQEMAIIKKFNKALENIDKPTDEKSTTRSEREQVAQEAEQENKDNQLEKSADADEK